MLASDRGVILSVAVFQAERRISRLTGLARKPNCATHSLTVHGGENQRLLGFDNAHAITEGTGPGARTGRGQGSNMTTSTRENASGSTTMPTRSPYWTTFGPKLI